MHYDVTLPRPQKQGWIMDRHDLLAMAGSTLAFAVTYTQIEQAIRVISGVVFIASGVVGLMYKVRKYRNDK